MEIGEVLMLGWLEIEKLEKQKRAAIDLLHGVNELDGLTAEVNKILTGAGVPQLGA